MEFNSFLTRFQANKLFFSVEVPDGNENNGALSYAISEQVRTIAEGGGPRLPEPKDDPDYDGRCWEFLSCKVGKVALKHLRAEPGEQEVDEDSRGFIKIGRSTQAEMLAPVDYNVEHVTKLLGFKNTLRTDDGKPDKFVVIGTLTQCPRSFPSAQWYPLNRC